MKSILALGGFLALFGSAANAQTDLGRLDKLATCQNVAQRATANQTLTFLENFKWWKIKNLARSIHPEYMSWHSSRVYLATLYPPAAVAKLPFKNGLVTYAGYIPDLAMAAYTNDVPRYTVDIQRLECVGNDTVIISSVFNGVSIYRDDAGKALYAVPIVNLATRFTIVVKDGLIYRNIIDVNDEASKKVMDQMGALIRAGRPNVAPGEIPDRSYDDILKDFLRQNG